MVKVCCFASAKGGSGKTTLCASFGHFLGAIGKKVLIIDGDIATHGLTLLYIDEVNEHFIYISERAGDYPPRGFFQTEGPGLYSDTDIVELPGMVYLLPSTYDFSDDINTREC